MMRAIFYLLASGLCGNAMADERFAGRWLGEAIAAHETIVIGLQIDADEDGALRARFTQPVVNYYDLPLPGGAKVEGELLRLPDVGLELRLRGDHLEGLRSAPDMQIRYRLQRSEALPEAPQPPVLPTAPGPRWQTRLHGQLWASPVAHGGRVFIGSSGGVVSALDGASGQLLWNRPLGAPVFAAVAVSADALFVASDSGLLHRLDPGDGSESWRYVLGGADVPRVLPHPAVFDWEWQAAAPVAIGGSVYIGAADGGFHAVAADNGQRRWRFDSGAAIRNAASVAGERVLFGNAKGWLFALDRESGRELWRVDTGAKVDTTPLVVGDAVIVGNRGRGLIAYALEDGSQRWRSPFWGSWVESTPLLHEGVLYVGGSDIRRVSALDPLTGKVLWRSDVFGWNFGTPLVVGDTLHIGAAGGTPYFIPHLASYSVLDRRDGRLLRRRPLADDGGHQWGIVGSPLRVGDHVIVATLAGSVLAFALE